MKRSQNQFDYFNQSHENFPKFFDILTYNKAFFILIKKIGFSRIHFYFLKKKFFFYRFPLNFNYFHTIKNEKFYVKF